MHLTPDILAGAYEYLRTTPPFRRWGLPPADEVEFHVTRHPKTLGDHQMRGSRHVIRISAKGTSHTESLMALMAHEIVHVYCDRRGIKTEHGTEFKRCAALVCREHGFDPKLF